MNLTELVLLRATNKAPTCIGAFWPNQAVRTGACTEALAENRIWSSAGRCGTCG